MQSMKRFKTLSISKYPYSQWNSCKRCWTRTNGYEKWLNNLPIQANTNESVKDQTVIVGGMT